jgi:hypothetical protein
VEPFDNNERFSPLLSKDRDDIMPNQVDISDDDRGLMNDGGSARLHQSAVEDPEAFLLSESQNPVKAGETDAG